MPSLVMLVLFPLAWADEPRCGPDALAEAKAAVAAMDRAMLDVDDSAFDEASTQLARTVACVSEVPTPADLLVLHGGMALAAFVNGQVTASKRSLIAARRISPDWEISGVLFSPTHPYRELYASAFDSSDTVPLPRAGRRTWVVDGFPSKRIPTERAFLLQQLNEGEVIWTGYVWDPSEVPDAERPGHPPFPWMLSAELSAAAVTSSQQGSGTFPLEEVREKQLAPTVSVGARYTPTRFAGVEGSFGMIQSLPSGQLVALFGTGWDVARPLQLHLACRAGARVETFQTLVAIPEGATSRSVSTIGSLVVGAEVGLRSQHLRALATADLPLARAHVPHELALTAAAGARVAGPFAVEGVIGYRPAWFVAEDTFGFPVGTRTESVWQAGLRAGLWLH